MRTISKVLCALLLLVTVSGHAPLVGSSDPCAVSGPYTDRLCAGQSLNNGEYLVSPDGNWRLYYVDGHLIEYRLSDSSVWMDWAPGTTGPTGDEWVYGEPTVESITGGAMNAAFWTDVNGIDTLDYYHVYTSGYQQPPLVPTGNHAFVIRNTGYLDLVDENGHVQCVGGPAC